MLKKIKVVIWSCVFCLVLQGAALAGRQADLQVTPDIIKSSFGSTQTDVKITGYVPPGSQVFIKLVNAPKTVTLSEKGKQGIFWLNKENVQIGGLPGFYTVLCTEPLGWLPDSLRAEMGLDKDYKSLMQTAVVTDAASGKKLAGGEKMQFVQALISMYKQKGLYQERIAYINPEKDGSFSYHFLLPANISPGQVAVQVYGIKNGQIVAQDENSMIIEKVGLAQWIGDMANDQGFLYGILAILVALAGGVSMDILFGQIEAGIVNLRRKMEQEREAANNADKKAKRELTQHM